MRLLLAASLLLVACGDGSSTDPVTEPPTAHEVQDPPGDVPPDPAPDDVAARPPALLVDTPAHDFGEVSDVHLLEHTFSFMNTGDEALVIHEVDAACGCTATELARNEIEGGGIETIGVVWETEGFGPQAKTITLRSNDPAQPAVVLTVTATIRPFVRATPPSIDLGQISGRDEHRGEVTLTCEDPAFELVRFDAPKELAVEVLEGPANGTARVAVVVRPTQRRGLFVPKVAAVVRGTLDGEVVEHTAHFRVSANLYQTLATAPPMLAAGKVAPGAAVGVETHVTRPDGGAFRIVDARLVGASGDGLEVTYEAHPDGGYRVRVTGTPVQAPGPLRAQVQLDTDLQEEPRVTLSLMGMVQ